MNAPYSGNPVADADAYHDARTLLKSAGEYIDGIPESAAGGDDEAVKLARDIKRFLERLTEPAL